MMDNVRILLAAHNGIDHIREMLDSILEQDWDGWHLIVSDDRSTDGTDHILEEYAHKYPKRITHYRSNLRFGNAQNHFLHLLREFQDAPYIMFCDQDDVWHKDKVSKTLAKMKDIENPGMPALVHTDLRVVDGDLKELDPSFLHFSNLRGDRLGLRHLLVQNVVTGCTVMINHALTQQAVKKLPERDVLMHDWWLALLASAVGTVGFLNEATIDYRQHGKNAVGAKNVRSVSYLWMRLRSQSMRQGMGQAAKQAEAFLKCYKDILAEEDKHLLSAFSQTLDAGFFRRNQIYLRYGLMKYGTLRIAAQLLGW